MKIFTTSGQKPATNGSERGRRHTPPASMGLRSLPAGTRVGTHRHDENQIVYAGRVRLWSGPVIFRRSSAR
ncbi:hypothetical protein ACWDRB_51035 [Nonomuraea sp. NPDC003707]